jgi:hypothetical protein
MIVGVVGELKRKVGSATVGEGHSSGKPSEKNRNVLCTDLDVCPGKRYLFLSITHKAILSVSSKIAANRHSTCFVATLVVHDCFVPLTTFAVVGTSVALVYVWSLFC